MCDIFWFADTSATSVQLHESIVDAEISALSDNCVLLTTALFDMSSQYCVCQKRMASVGSTAHIKIQMHV